MQVPYGSTFFSHLQWDAVKVGQKQTRLRVSCEVGPKYSLPLPKAVSPTPNGISSPEPCSMRGRRILSIKNLWAVFSSCQWMHIHGFLR